MDVKPAVLESEKIDKNASEISNLSEKKLT